MYNMKKVMSALLCAVFLFGLPYGASADDHGTAPMQEAVTEQPVERQALQTQALQQLSKDTDFVVYAPQLPHTDWKLEIPVPYPHLPGKKIITFTRFSYFDMSGDIYLMGVEQHKAHGYKTTRSITSIDIKNKTTKTKQVEYEFKFDLSGEPVTWNDIEGRFKPWATSQQNGGFLTWIQGDTYIEMSSVVFTREQMIEVAKSMKPVQQ